MLKCQTTLEEALQYKPDDATYLYLGSSDCAAFFCKKDDAGVNHYSYGKGSVWRPLFKDPIVEDILDNPSRMINLAALEEVVEDQDTPEPLPEWALCLNEHKVLVPGTQLATKDGRLTGNAHIISTRVSGWDNTVRIYDCLTDAGNKISLTEKELHRQFYVGVFISHVDDVLDKFDRDNLFYKEPK